MVFADRDKIKQVLLNLVKNGVEAIEEPGADACVRITARSEPADGKRQVRVTVTDNGKGIPPEKLRKVTEPFYSDKPGGTGLGLAIVSRILQLHGTELRIDSNPAVAGTRVHFLLPACNESFSAK
jgi:two-component system sporulation sensor kinase A